MDEVYRRRHRRAVQTCIFVGISKRELYRRSGVIKIKDESIEIEGSVEEVTKEFTLIAIHLIEIFEKKFGKLFTPAEILLAGATVLEKEQNDD